jgi:alkylation response protein AidB-like acyl-CoA dehydrogenase
MKGDMAFFQDPPSLGNTFADDHLLQDYLGRQLTPAHLAEVGSQLAELGELAAGPLYRMQQEDRLNEPRLTHWDPWGHRIDHIEVSPLWQKAQQLAAQHGMVAVAYEGRHGEHARVEQMVRAYLLEPSMDVYACPLAMTDGATRTLLDLGNQELIERAVPRLTSRDPKVMWTSGQWMTERTGGSDVGLSETEARQSPEPGGGWRLYGTKWFTSATTSQMTLTLARPEGNGPGGRGLALFYLELRDANGRLNGIRINRLKDKLGTRKVPTAELSLEGVLATPVAGLSDGIRNISSMLNVTRTWNAVMSAAGMRRGMMLAKSYADRRVAFGAPLARKPLHVDTLASMEAETQGAFLLAFRAAELLGRREAGVATEQEQLLLRVMTPVAKLTTGKQAVAVASEVLEAFGGAGYIEDTGLPRLLRDAQVLPIWEGTTNVLSLETLKALGTPGAAQALQAEVGHLLSGARNATDPQLAEAAQAVQKAMTHAQAWLTGVAGDMALVEAGARRFALTVGRSLEVAHLVAQAAWGLSSGRPGGKVAAAAARRMVRHGIDLMGDAAGAAAEAAEASLLAARV